MTFQNFFSILIFSLLLGCIGYFLRSSRMNKDGEKMKRIPLSNVLTAVADEMIKAHINAEERGYAIMKFAECEFEFSVESEEQQGGKVTLWALEVTGGGKQTESNKVRIKYTNTEIPVAAAVAIELPEPDTNEGESSTP